MQYTAIRFIKRPTGAITPDVFEQVTLQTPALDDGEMLLKQTHMHLAPSMRGWMNDEESYIAPLELGEIMRSIGVSEVVESRHQDYPVGTKLFGPTGWREYLVSDGTGQTVLPPSVPAEAVLCLLSPGLTAYFGLMNLSSPTAGETLVVSGGAGSVGSLVGQIGKHAGLSVIGTAGSEEKRRWLVEELGFDHALDHRSPELAAELAATTPNGVDIFFENTGGAIQQLVFDRMNVGGRITVCGMISEYNDSALSPGPNWLDVNRKRLTIKGFVISDHMDQAAHITPKLLELFMAGKLKYRAHTLRGLESAIDGINLLFTGGNTGKLLVEL